MRARSLSLVVSLGLAALAPLAVGACGGGGANFPDRSDVVAAQAAWCDALVKAKAASADNVGACKGTYPTASGPYLRAMTKCVAKAYEDAGDKATDAGHVVAVCEDEIIHRMKPDESIAAGVVDARCSRMERCEKVAVSECKAAFTKLEGSLRVVLTVKYNGAALQSVAECLKDTACGQDEDAAREACYKKANEKLLWFPG